MYVKMYYFNKERLKKKKQPYLINSSLVELLRFKTKSILMYALSK